MFEDDVQSTSGGESPSSLLLLCVREVVINELDIKNVALPQEICNLIFEVFRAENINKLLDEKDCEKFLSQFMSKNSRISHADLSDLPITDDCLVSFVREHSKSLVHIDISNCPRLTDEVLERVNKLFTQLNDFSKVVCHVVLTEANSEGLIKRFDKRYENGVLEIQQKADEGPPRSLISTVDKRPIDIFSLYQVLGVFDEPTFKEWFSKNSDSGGCGDVKWSTSERSSVPVGTTQMEVCSSDGLENSVLETFTKTVRHKRKFKNTVGDVTSTLTVEFWQDCPLATLIIGKSTQILPESVDDMPEKGSQKKLINPHFRLRKLVIQEWTSVDDSQYLNSIITAPMMQSLQHLDLSNCSSIGNGSTLLKLSSLKTLILYNIPKLHQAIKSIGCLKSLRYLDISASNDRFGHGYKQPEEQLAELVDALPGLTHLDISGTNLAGNRCEFIKGLKSRHGRPFEFLGLYNTANEGSYRTIIPAIKIAGDATEEQVLTACELYIDRVEFLRKTLNDLFHCFRFETNFHDLNRALDVVLLSMSRHLAEKQIQIAASASLFYIVKSDEFKHNFNMTIKREIIKKLLDAMQTHRYDTTMLRNGSLTLIHFKIPQDVLFEYSRLVDILLHIVTNDDDDFIQRLGIYLLNSLACQVDGEQKILVGNLGAITKMLALIEGRLNRDLCDEVMETAWSTMWNVTDETPVNCERFLESDGMEYFVRCMTKFSHSAELLRNMMGLLGNVAECHHLRYRLMQPRYIEKFSELLSSDSDGIEVSYNAAGILSHIASDGLVFWQKYLPDVDRVEVLERMRFAISRWKINSKRNINYRSFEPILRLLGPDQATTEAMYWAVWALANLTRVYCTKYCPLLVEDGGIVILEQLIKRQNLPQHISQLIRVTLLQVELWNTQSSLGGLEDSEEINVEPDHVMTC